MKTSLKIGNVHENKTRIREKEEKKFDPAGADSELHHGWKGKKKKKKKKNVRTEEWENVKKVLRKIIFEEKILWF